MGYDYLELILKLEKGDKSVLNHTWLNYLNAKVDIENINIEGFNQLKSIKSNAVLNYVKRCFESVERQNISDNVRKIVNEVIAWSEVAKCGNLETRQEWLNLGYNLSIHNIGSCEIFMSEAKVSDYDYKTNELAIIKELIKTHGYIGQFIRGEVSIEENYLILSLIEDGLIEKDMLRDILITLNRAIIEGVSLSLYTKIENRVLEVIDNIIEGKLEDMSYEDRICHLRGDLIDSSEIDTSSKLKALDYSLWYVESATKDFTTEEFFKVLFVVGEEAKKHNVNNISFMKLMNNVYYDFNGKKKINVYKKRIIEKILKNINMGDFKNSVLSSENVSVCFEVKHDTLFMDFKFSNIADKLIDFCVAAEGNGAIYDKAIIMLYDLFDLRRDAYDRFNNEDTYLETMNQSIDHKAKLLDFVVGDNVLDVGPGGGALLDLLEDRFPSKNIMGVDISSNVVEVLNKKKQIEDKNWSVYQGNVLDLENTFNKGDIDTVILSSIVHELFSYIPYNEKKFNYDTIKDTFKSILNVLPSGGRIIIRDGVMSDSSFGDRIIRFKTPKGIDFLKRYANDFKGRDIRFTEMDPLTYKMPINDAMEFLYTYTWGENSYAHEINEQFGYFTPSQYKEFLLEVSDNKCEIIECNHFLQEGYAENLEKLVEFYDSEFNVVPLPDSTIILVIEKK